MSFRGLNIYFSRTINVYAHYTCVLDRYRMLLINRTRGIKYIKCTPGCYESYDSPVDASRIRFALKIIPNGKSLYTYLHSPNKDVHDSWRWVNLT